MSLSVFWDAAFNVRALMPALKSANLVTSPTTIAAGETKNVQLWLKTKAFMLTPTSEAVSLEITIAKSDSGGVPVVEDGKITLTSLVDGFVLPTEGIKFVCIKNASASSVSVSFMLMGVAGGEYVNPEMESMPFTDPNL